MRVIYSTGGPAGGGLWVLPLLGGLTLIAVGVLIVIYPPILAYAVAFLMISAGVSLLGMALTWRTAFRNAGGMAGASQTREAEWEVVDSPGSGRMFEDR